jgi:hypothetical protein
MRANANRRHSSGKWPRRLPASSGAARRQSRRLVWPRHVGTDRLVGGVPTLLGACSVSGWTGRIREPLLDARAAGHADWFIGCANAWHWVDQQDKAMHDEEDKDE